MEKVAVEKGKSNVRVESISPEILGDDVKQGHIFNDPDWFLYRQKWKNNPIEGKVESVPLQIDLFAVEICNLKCPMCPRGFWEKKDKKGYMATEDIIKIIDSATASGRLWAFNFGGLGEPTIHPDIVKIIKYAKSKGVVDVNIHTNATLLTPELSKNLITSGLDRIIFSLDSAVKESYEKIRIGANFEKVYNNVETFIKLKRKYAFVDEHGQQKPDVRLNFINMDENDSTEKDIFVNRWKDKVDRIAILRYLDYSCYEESYEELTFKENYTQDPKYSCSELWRRLAIWKDGSASICFRDFNCHFSVGNVFEQSIEDIWRGDKMNKFREKHQSGNFQEIPICNTCPDSYYCK